MFVSFVIAVFLTFVNLQNCPNDYDQFKTENSTNLQKNLEVNQIELWNLQLNTWTIYILKNLGKEDVNTSVIISTKKMSQL